MHKIIENLSQMNLWAMYCLCKNKTLSKIIKKLNKVVWKLND